MYKSISGCLVSRNYGRLFSRLCFQGCLSSEWTWKIEMISLGDKGQVCLQPWIMGIVSSFKAKEQNTGMFPDHHCNDDVSLQGKEQTGLESIIRFWFFTLSLSDAVFNYSFFYLRNLHNFIFIYFFSIYPSLIFQFSHFVLIEFP